MECQRSSKRGKLSVLLPKSGDRHGVAACLWFCRPHNPSHRFDEHSAQIPRPAPERNELRNTLLGTIASRLARAAYRTREPEPAWGGVEHRPGRLAKRPAPQ